MSRVGRIPIRFKTLAAVFGEMAKPRVCSESSGSEHSQENSTDDLSDLVNSFLERESEEFGEEKERQRDYKSEINCSNLETKVVLKRLLFDYEDDDAKKRVYAEVEEALVGFVGGSTPGFKRRLVAWLRDRGFDAGLCKSKWEKTKQFPYGKHEYIDVNVAENRYIIEISLAREFEIARPTDYYTALLHTFPPIFVGKAEELKQVVRLMCNAIKTSMRTVGMPVPPWRRLGCMQNKWFGSYKRTINEIPEKKCPDSDNQISERSVGFVPLVSDISYYCREEFGSKVGLKVGNLAMALNGASIMLL